MKEKNIKEPTSAVEVKGSNADETKSTYDEEMEHRLWKDVNGEMVYVVRCVMKDDVISALEDEGDIKVGKALRDSINNLSDEDMCALARDFSNAFDDIYWESLYYTVEHFLEDEIKKNEKEV